MYYKLIDDSENFRNYKMVGYTQEYANQFDGRSQKSSYKPVTFKVTQETENKYSIADFQAGYLPICSEKAKKIIEKICDENEVEFLPCYLEGVDEQYYILNILGLEDCVDYDKSKFTKFPSDPNKVMAFEHIEFKEKVNRHFFRIKDLPYCHYFISQEAKDRLEKTNLKGFVFNGSLFN